MTVTKHPKGRGLYILATYLIMTGYAVSMTMLAPIMLKLTSYYGISLAQGGLMTGFQNIGGAIALTGVFFLSGRFSAQRLYAVAAAVYAATLALTFLKPGFSALLLIFALMGMGARTIDSISNACVSDAYPDGAEKQLLLLHTFFGIGAFFGPFFSGAISEAGIGWEWSFLLLAVVCFALFFVFIIAVRRAKELLPSKPSAMKLTEDNSNWRTAKLILTDKNIFIGCIAIFIFNAGLAGILTWMSAYIQSYLNGSMFISTLGASLYWVGVIVSRLSTRFWLKWFKRFTVVSIGLFAAFAVLTIGVLSSNIPLTLASIGLCGFFAGPFFPLLISFCIERKPSASGQISALLFIFCFVSAIISPWFVGFIADTAGFQAAILSIAVMILMTVPFMLILRKRDNGSK